MTALWLRTTLRKQLLGHPRAMPGVWGRFARHRILPRKEFMGREPDQKRALLLQQPTEQVVAHVTRVADQEHALEDRLGERLQQIDQVATFPRLGCPQAPGPEDPSGQADQGD